MRIYDFVSSYDEERAASVAQQLVDAPKLLGSFRRRGSLLSEFGPREVREFRVGGYLLRYELAGDDIFILRLFHARENRFD
jgi:plasmid stabilization system protein ParE